MFAPDFPVKLFLKFNKVKAVTSRIQDVIHAIEANDSLQVRVGGQMERWGRSEVSSVDKTSVVPPSKRAQAQARTSTHKHAQARTSTLEVASLAVCAVER